MSTKRCVMYKHLTNNIRVLLVPESANNIVALSAFFPLAAAEESYEYAGLTELMWSSLLTGTLRHNQKEFSEAVESLGTSLTFQAGRDFSTASCVCTSDALLPSLELYFEALNQPRFDPDEFEKERQATLANIREALDDKSTFAMRTFAEILFAQGTYGIPVIGTEESVQRIQLEQVKSLYNNKFSFGNTVFVAVGNFDPDVLLALIEKNTAGRNTQRSLASEIVPHYVTGIHHSLTRSWEQSFLVMGFPACSITSDDFFPLRVLIGVLGDGMSSRFFVQLRDERGLAYATGCHLNAYRYGGFVAGYIGTKPENLDEARRLMEHLFRQATEEKVPTDELERVKNYLVGKYLISHQRNSSRAGFLGSYEMLGLGWNMDEEYPDRIRAVSADEMLAVAQKYLATAPTIVEITPANRKMTE